MLALVFKVLGMIIPFLKEAFLNRNKFKRNKTIAILVILNITFIAAFFFSGDVVFKLYKDNQSCKETMLELENKIIAEKADKEADINLLNSRLERLIMTMEKEHR